MKFEEIENEILHMSRIIYNLERRIQIYKKEKEVLINIKREMCSHEYKYDNTCCFDDKFKYKCDKCGDLQPARYFMT
jgi:hypothetical protein